MNEPNENGIGWEPYVWRGALGGALGNLLVVLFGAAYVLLRFGNSALLRHLLLFGGVLALVAGTIVGLVIGFVIFEVTRKSGRRLNMLLRVLIGSICFLAYMLLTGLNSSRTYPMAFTVIYAVLVGGLAGLMAREKASSDSVAGNSNFMQLTGGRGK